MSCVQGRPWSLEEKRRLQSLRTEKDRQVILRSFPDRTEGAVLAALLRCASKADNSAPPKRIDREEVRLGFRALSMDAIVDRLPSLLERNARFGRPMKGAHE